MKKTVMITIIVLLIIGCSVLGYITYNLKGNSTKYQNEIENYKTQIKQLKESMANNSLDTNEVKQNCLQIIKGSQYIVENSGNDNSNNGPTTEKTSMTFGNDNKVQQISGTAAWEDNYSISQNIITFENNKTKSYGIISQDCKTIYKVDTQSSPNIKIYQRKNNIAGYYKAGSMINSEKIDENCVKGTREIVLLNNGTFKSAYSSGCDGAKQSGTYKKENNKIILTCDNNSEQCPEGTTKEYILNNDESLSDSPTNNDNTSIGIYKKVNYNQLELLK